MCPEADLPREELIAFILELRAENAALTEEVARLRGELGKKGGPPSWVKANTPPREKAPRQKRAKGASRQCAADAEPREHAVDICPDCGNALTGGWDYSSRETLVRHRRGALLRTAWHAERVGAKGHPG